MDKVSGMHSNPQEPGAVKKYKQNKVRIQKMMKTRIPIVPPRSQYGHFFQNITAQSYHPLDEKLSTRPNRSFDKWRVWHNLNEFKNKWEKTFTLKNHWARISSNPGK